MRRLLVVVVALAVMAAAFLVSWRIGTRPPPARSTAVGPTRAGPTLDRPHVVLIVGCTMRWDQVAPYGGPPAVTPFLGRAAQAGALFEQSIAAAPWTKAAMGAMLTGRHAASIGLVEPGPGANRRRLAEQATTLAELFRAGGYQTFGATANPNLNEVFGFGQGFDAYVEGTDLWRLGGQAKLDGPELVKTAAPLLRKLHRPDVPLFAQFVFTDAHGPPLLPSSEIDAFSGRGVPRRVAAYRAMLNRFDQLVERLERGLGGIGLHRDNTVFVVVNDHGEGLRTPIRHGLGHGNFTYASTARMPWIVWGRDIAANHRIGGMASAIDLVPTLTGLASVPGYDGPGRDHAELLRGRGAHTGQDRAFIDTWFQSSRRAGVYAEGINCHEDYAAEPETVQLPGRDATRRVPRECVADDALRQPVDDARAAELLAALDAFHAEMETAYVAWPHTADAEPDDDVKRQLEALGYVDGGEGYPEEASEEDEEP